MAEITNLFMLATRSSIEFCVTFFVAFHVLQTIDNIYAEGVCEYALLHAIEHPLQFKKKPKEIEFKERKGPMKVLRVFLVVMQFFYNSVYYYYMPYFINFVPYFAVGDPALTPAVAH